MMILNIGQAVRQVFKNYWVNQDAANVNLQEILLTPETEIAEEEHSNQSNSDEESDSSLDSKPSF